MRSNPRLVSTKYLAAFGVIVPAHLPPLDTTQVRDEEDVVARLLCLSACGAVAYGFLAERASAWIEREGLQPFLQPEEDRFLGSGEGHRERFQYQIEGASALAWALGIHDEFDFSQPCSDQFVFLMPDLKADETSAQLRQRVKLRPADALHGVADLGYCINWALREPFGSKLPFQLMIVEERRRALEWLLTSEPWYEISLDT